MIENGKNTIVELIPSTQKDIDKIENIWRDLEHRSNCHVFLSWDWIGPWIKNIEGKFYLLKATSNEKVVGLGFIFEKIRKVFGLFHITQWWLNRTGIEKFDQSWIEYNDFLVDQDVDENVRECLVDFVSTQNAWDEFIVGMSCKHVEDLFKNSSKNIRYILEDVGYYVDLKSINSSYLLEIPSKNTRQQIKRSEKLLAEKGKLKFEVKEAIEQPVKELIKDFHIKRWRNTNTPSGFEGHIFSSVFQEQIDTIEAEISALTLDGQIIGCLVNFKYEKNVYFYLSALSDEYGGKIKLGMFLHSLAIEYYRKKNFIKYDFLAGDARYKSSLANNTYSHNMFCLFRNRFSLSVENLFRTLKKYRAFN